MSLSKIFRLFSNIFSGVFKKWDSEDLAQLKPFLSVLTICVTLFSIVFLQMEERRMGYAILKLTREQKSGIEKSREKTIQLARVLRPQQIEKTAQSKFGVRPVQAHQIIHLTGAPLTSQAGREMK